MCGAASLLIVVAVPVLYIRSKADILPFYAKTDSIIRGAVYKKATMTMQTNTTLVYTYNVV